MNLCKCKNKKTNNVVIYVNVKNNTNTILKQNKIYPVQIWQTVVVWFQPSPRLFSVVISRNTSDLSTLCSDLSTLCSDLLTLCFDLSTL